MLNENGYDEIIKQAIKRYKIKFNQENTPLQNETEIHNKLKGVIDNFLKKLNEDKSDGLKSKLEFQNAFDDCLDDFMFREVLTPQIKNSQNYNAFFPNMNAMRADELRAEQDRLMNGIVDDFIKKMQAGGGVLRNERQLREDGLSEVKKYLNDNKEYLINFVDNFKLLQCKVEEHLDRFYMEKTIRYMPSATQEHKGPSI